MKRTAHVALVVMAAAGIGGTAYSMMPIESCVRSDGGAPVNPNTPACRNSSSGSGGGHGSRSMFGSSGGSNSGGGSSSTPSAFSSASTTRGGFGSFAHAIAAHIGG